MYDEIIFNNWDESCDRVVNGYASRWNPYILKLLPDVCESKTHESVTTRVLEDGGKLYVDYQKLHSEPLVRQAFQENWRRRLLGNIAPISFLNDICPYCKEQLHHTQQYFDIDSGDELDAIGELEVCLRCNYWAWHYLDIAYIGRWGIEAQAYTNFMGKLRTFDSKLPEGCANEIASWIRRNPSKWHTINPTDFERLVADIFRSNLDYAEVTHVGRPDDGGVDVIYVDANNKQWLVQVKRREKPDSVEPVSTIRNLLGTMVLEGSNYGMVTSTADHFSYRAFEAVQKASERGMTVRIFDRYALDHMLDATMDDRPWLPSLRLVFPQCIDELLVNTPCRNVKQLSFFE